MNTILCTPSFLQSTICDFLLLLFKPLKTVFLGVGTEQVRRGYGAGLSQSPIATRRLMSSVALVS
mgnify:CR=1 FL=1